MSTEEQIDELLDNHAEYYIKQTMKFFQENGESPALSKNNEGDLTAKAKINKLLIEAEINILRAVKVADWYGDPTAYIEFDGSDYYLQEYIEKILEPQLRANIKGREA